MCFLWSFAIQYRYTHLYYIDYYSRSYIQFNTVVVVSEMKYPNIHELFDYKSQHFD